MRSVIAWIFAAWAVWAFGLMLTVWLMIEAEDDVGDAAKKCRPVLLLVWPVLMVGALTKLMRKAWKWAYWHMRGDAR